MTIKRLQTRLVWLVLGAALLAVIAYHMAWQEHKVAAFSNNAFDLAEWMSLHPAVRAEDPPLQTSWFLRLPLILVGVIVALAASQLQNERGRWLWRLIAIGVVLRLNPPVEFYQSVSRNIAGRERTIVTGYVLSDISLNEQQLGNLMIYGLVMVGAAILLARWVRYVACPLIIAAAGYALYAADKGLSGADEIVGLLQLRVTSGSGYRLFYGALVAMILSAVALSILQWQAWWRQWARRRVEKVSMPAIDK